MGCKSEPYSDTAMYAASSRRAVMKDYAHSAQRTAHVMRAKRNSRQKRSASRRQNRPMMPTMKVYKFDAPTPQGSATLDQQRFMLAMDFHEGALRAGVEDRDPEGAPICSVHTMVVSLAFAGELYLKSLTPVGTGKAAVKGHKLHVLFGRLSDDVRGVIADAYEHATGRPVKALEYDLRKFSGAFEEWRYVFEGDGQEVHINLLIAFVRASYAAVRHHQPEWAVRDFQDARLRTSASDSMTLKNLGGGVFVHAVDGTGTLNTSEA